MDPGLTASRQTVRQWSTDAVDPARRLDYWAGAICEAFLEMDCSSRAAGSFEGTLSSRPGSELRYNQVRAATHDVFRTPLAIARGRSHPFYLITQLHAPWHVRQGGELLHLRGGDAVLVDSAQRYELHFPHSVACLSIQMPRAWVGRWLADLDVPRARVAWREQGWGRALSALCLQLGDDPALAACYPPQLLDEQVGAMLAAALEPRAAARPVSGQPVLLERIEHLLLQWLDQPGLSGAGVAAELGLSVRTLHRAFAAARMTFAGRLRQLRMERAAQLLAQPRLRGVSVAEIGRRCGYGDPSHFAREFGKAWGEGPARWRMARIGQPPGSHRPAATPSAS